ncbi:MAG: UDP-N-acetylglucosamine--N-acetylmuramyl-(pentapeptide) pyrophosphoryl-undecaprenol N-acetylglucosamine transferase [Candidatus Omnitrophica bacterium]|nr:UDP-N-acetylglucosamine--N-acetylmuramyl-(pentapeptide) pyrophosphoryl-undecaprenol N-acetylglucosamine transferase [Candidatus Omnitrophota bacterium]
MKILLVSEKSAGHVYPALAIAEKIRDKRSRKDSVIFFNNSRFFKAYIQSKGYSAFGSTYKFRNFLNESIWRCFEAVYLIIKIRPGRVIGFGGRSSFFLVLFSFIFGRKTSIYEPNLKMGRANRLLSCFVKDILRGICSLDKAKNYKVIGIPLGKNIVKKSKEKLKKSLNFDQRPVVLCFGGSQGSAFINSNFFNFVKRNKDNLYQIVHITGKNNYSHLANSYKLVDNNKIIKDFCPDMSTFYNIADGIVSRAGALTLAEISFYNIPAILIPHPGAFGHQRINARYLGNNKAAFVFNQDDFNFEKFEICLNKIIWDNSTREEIKNNLKKIKIGVSYEDFSFNSII